MPFVATVVPALMICGVATAVTYGAIHLTPYPHAEPAPPAGVDEPLMAWLLAGLVGLAGFIGLVFRRVMDRQDKLHDANTLAAADRERRLQDRADAQLQQTQTHIVTLQAIATNLGSLNQRIDDVPLRVVARMRSRGSKSGDADDDVDQGRRQTP